MPSLPVQLEFLNFEIQMGNIVLFGTPRDVFSSITLLHKYVRFLTYFVLWTCVSLKKRKCHYLVNKKLIIYENSSIADIWDAGLLAIYCYSYLSWMLTSPKRYPSSGTINECSIYDQEKNGPSSFSQDLKPIRYATHDWIEVIHEH